MSQANEVRYAQLRSFLDAYFTQPYQVESLAGDASFRRYHRIYVGDEQFLLMDAPPDKEDVVPFVTVANVLSTVVNVPDILQQDLTQGFLLLQDFGTVEFAHLIADTQFGDKQQHYTKALQTLADIQKLDVTSEQVSAHIAPYSNEKLAVEMNLFSEWFLPYIGVELNKDEEVLWQTLKQTIIAKVLAQPKVVVHRDYHSRNLMQDKNSEHLGVIDFQDALVGAYSYDLVSLVRDAYIDFDEAWVHETIRQFYDLKELADTLSLEQFIADVNVMGVQRHLKVLGIFVRLYQRDGKARYLDNIPKVMTDLCVELNWLCQYETKSEDKAVFEAFTAWLTTQVLPAYHTKFEKAVS